MRVSSSGTPETSVVFYSAGGHDHNGISSSLIDYTKYSVFDFNTGIISTDATRRSRQETNLQSFKNFIIDTVNTSVLSPAGVVLGANSVGASEIVSGSITSNELSANLILVNNVIRSNTYTEDTEGWIINSNGNAEFNNVKVRGTIVSSEGTIGGWTIGSSTLTGSSIRLNATGSVVMNTTIGSNIYTTSISTSGFRNQWYDSPNNAYALYTIGPTAATHTGFWVNSNSLADSAIRERIYYFTNGIFMDSRAANGGTYSDGLVRLYVTRDGTNSYGVLDILTKNNSGTQIQNVQIFNGSVSASGSGSFGSVSSSGAGSFASVSASGSGSFGSVSSSGSGSFDSLSATSSSSIGGVTLNNNTITIGASRGIVCNGNFATTSSSTTARIHDPGSGSEIMRAPSSSVDYKYNISDIPNALNIINSVRPRIFNWKIDAFDENDPSTNLPWSEEAKFFNEYNKSYGFIAEEIAEDQPELTVWGRPEGSSPYENPEDYFDITKWKPKMWKEMDFIPILTQAVKELLIKIEDLEFQINQLKGVN